MTAKQKRKRRLTRTGVETRKLKPRKAKSETSGPIEINHYTYGVLYDRFLTQYLKKLNPDNEFKIDKRSFPPMKNIFFPPDNDIEQYEVIPSKSMLKKAQQAVLQEIERQFNQSKRSGRISGLERMFYLATKEPDLVVDWDMMRRLVKEAKLMKFTGADAHDMGYMDPNINRIKINSNHKMTMYDIKVTLMHEVMHNTVKRYGRPGNPEISEATEHLAMALCGDPDEFTVLLDGPSIKVDPPARSDWCWLDESEYEEGDYDGEQPPHRDGQDTEDWEYDERRIEYIERLGFSLEDIPDKIVCSPPLQRRIESTVSHQNTRCSPAYSSSRPGKLKRSATV